MPELVQPPSDQEVLELLARALAPTAVEPPAEAVREVRLLAARRVVGPPADAGRQRSSQRPRRWITPVVVAGLVVTGAGSAFAAGVPVLKPLRALAADVGLPVTPTTSPAVAHAQDAKDKLSTALRRGSKSNAPSLARDARVFAAALAQLSRRDRANLRVEARRELAEACRKLAGVHAPPVRRQTSGVCQDTDEGLGVAPALKKQLSDSPPATPTSPVGSGSTTCLPKSGTASSIPAPTRRHKVDAGGASGRASHHPKAGRCRVRPIR